MKKWNIFFSCVTVIIIVCMMLPQVFGMQSFTQWGGMYVSGWCAASTWSNVEGKESVYEYFNSPTSRVTWFDTMHNEETCLAWTQSWCGKEKKKGQKIYSVVPYFRGAPLMGETNVCDLPASHAPWFEQL